MKERTPDTTGRPVEDERVTVVVASRNRRDDLVLTLRRHRAPVILVDNGSRDGTIEFVSAEFPDVRMIRMGRNAGAFGRTICAQAAGTEFVAFADDDSWWAAGALRMAADLLSGNPAVAAVVGHILVGPEARPDPFCVVLEQSPLPAASTGHPSGRVGGSTWTWAGRQGTRELASTPGGDYGVRVSTGPADRQAIPAAAGTGRSTRCPVSRCCRSPRRAIYLTPVAAAVEATDGLTSAWPGYLAQVKRRAVRTPRTSTARSAQHRCRTYPSTGPWIGDRVGLRGRA